MDWKSLQLSFVAIGLSLTMNSLAVPVNIGTSQIIDQQSGEWLSHGRDYQETRFSPLKQINSNNVQKLGLAWATDLDVFRGFESTPLYHDGLLYASGPRGVVFAFDAKTGAVKWQFDPKSDRIKDKSGCCNVVNRGVALWDDKVYVGSFDGRLIALDAKTGNVKWQAMTVDPDKDQTITGAPRVVKGKVIIGFGGADMGNSRGYVSAYDAQTGKLIWRFYTVPGDPSKPFENKAMANAAKTWTGQWWKYGGGGTVWDSMSYDPELDLLYIGVGNGSPWNHSVRSPQGGDNLYLSSIVALRPDTGEYVWHYQTTPGETWDYTATQHMILTDLVIDGKKRKVIMQAPKNGFFYVLDRTNGQLISAEKFAKVNWAFSIDKKTGRPIEVPGARFEDGFAFIYPSPFGAHNWQPMSYNPLTGLVYIPVFNLPVKIANQEHEFKIQPGHFNVGVNMFSGEAPRLPYELRVRLVNGDLLAWDPVAQKQRWKVHHESIWNSGTLTTAGNLVFQGTADAMLTAYDASTGKKLWQFDAQTGLTATPMTYEVDGVQYIAIMAGWGGIGALVGDAVGHKQHQLIPRMLVFKLNGDRTLPSAPKPKKMPKPPAINVTTDSIKRGGKQFHQYCGRCHGFHAYGGGEIADIRFMNKASWDIFHDIVLRGVYLGKGMPRFDDVLDDQSTQDIKNYLLKQANDAYAEQQKEES